jgi:hypothetical protein
MNRRDFFRMAPRAVAATAATAAVLPTMVEAAQPAPPAAQLPNTLPDFTVHEVMQFPDRVVAVEAFHGNLYVLTERSCYEVRPAS